MKAASDGGSRHVVCQGDLIALHGAADGLGFLSVPRSSEPFPEREESISHLRACSSAVDNAPSDFSERCLFRIEVEKGQVREGEPIQFGAIVRLKHEASGCTIVSSDIVDCTIDGATTASSLFLRKHVTEEEEPCALWCITPKYSIKSEGDFVVHDDYVVFKSLRYSKKLLISMLSQNPNKYDHIVGIDKNKIMPSGWQLKVVSQYTTESKIKQMDSKFREVRGGDYIRLKHLQSKGYLLSRVDDSKESASLVAPLGLLARKAMTAKENTHSLYIQNRASDRTEDELTSDSTTIWQITSEIGEFGFGSLSHGSSVRLRNIVSGLYLCIREKNMDDDPLLSHSILPEFSPSLILATTSDKDENSLFRIFSFDNGGRSHQHSKSVLYGECISFQHCVTKLMFQHSGKNSSKNTHSLKLVVPSASVVCQESYKMEVVQSEDIIDILFAKRFFNIASMAIACIQKNDISEVYLPLYKHWHVSLYTLALWIQDAKFEPDSALYAGKVGSRAGSARSSHFSRKSIDDENDEDSDEEDDVHVEEYHENKAELRRGRSYDADESSPTWRRGTKLKPSSMVQWLDRKESAYSIADLSTGLDSLRNSDVSAVFIPVQGNSLQHRIIRRRRQDLLRETKLLELLMHFNCIIYTLVSAETLRLKHAFTEAEMSERERQHNIPQILPDCCRASYDLISLAVRENKTNASLLISISGVLLSLINHEVENLMPPIEAILVSAQRNKNVDDDSLLPENSTQFTFSEESINPLNSISPYDVQHLIRQMYELFAKGDRAALHMLSLLSVLCSPGETPNKAFQDTALPIIFPYSSSVSGTTLETGQALSALFSTKFDEAGDKKWHILIRSNLLLRDNKVPDLDLKLGLEKELDCLLDVFSRYNKNDDDILNDVECKRLLEDLGLGGAALSTELEALKETELCGFICWWWGHRKLYFSTSSTVLNAVTPLESFEILFGESFRNFQLQGFESPLLSRRNSASKAEYGQNNYASLLTNNLFICQLNEKVNKIAAEVSILGVTGVLKAKNKFRRSLGGFESPESLFNDATTNVSDEVEIPKMRKIEASGGGAAFYQNVMISTEDSRSADVSAIHFQSSRQWKNIEEIVSAETFESEWFGKSLFFLAALCRGRNLICQKTVSRLVPAELLMEMLGSDNLNIGEKSLALNLLTCVYVENDLVYSIQSHSLHQPIMIGVDGCINNTFEFFVTAGKVFNVYSRAQFEDGYWNGPKLRTHLRSFMEIEITKLKLNLSDTEEDKPIISYARVVPLYLEYARFLLKLLKNLLRLDFFDDKEDYKDGNAEDSTDAIPVCSAITSCFSLCSQTFGDLGFSGKNIEKVLIEKLNSFLDALKQHRQFSSRSQYTTEVQDTITNTKEHVLFDDIFSSDIRSSVFYELVSGLTVLYDTEQLNNVLKLTSKLTKDNNLLYDPTDSMMEEGKLYDGNNEIEVKFELCKRSVDLIQRELSDKDTKDVNYLQAVLVASLFKNTKSPLQDKVYSLLNRQTSPKSDAERIFKDMHIFMRQEEAYVHRLIVVLKAIVLKQLHQFVSDTRQSTPRAYLLKALEVIEFSVDAIKSLCFRRLRRKDVSASGSTNGVGLSSRQENGTVQRSIAVVSDAWTYVWRSLKSSMRSDENNSSIEMTDSRYQQMSEEAFPESDDELDTVVMGGGAVVSTPVASPRIKTIVDEEYVLDHNLFDISPVVECFDLLRPFVLALVDFVCKIFKDGSTSYDCIPMEDRQVIDLIGKFLLHICYHSVELSECVWRLRFISKYVTASNGCCDILSVIFRHAPTSSNLDEARILLEELMNQAICNWRQNFNHHPLCVFYAIFQNEKLPEIVTEATALVLDNVLRNGDMRDAVVLGDYFSSSEAERCFNFSILRLLSVLPINEKTKPALREIIVSGSAIRVLDSKQPLLVKSTMLRISSQIYNYSIVHSVDYIYASLAQILRHFETSSDTKFLDNNRFSIQDFVVRGCLPSLKRSARNWVQEGLIDQAEKDLKRSLKKIDPEMVINGKNSWSLLQASQASLPQGGARRSGIVSPTLQRSTTATMNGVHPTLFFDTVLMLQSLLFSNKFAVLETLNTSSDDKNDTIYDTIERFFVETVVIVCKIANPDSPLLILPEGSRLHRVYEELRENTLIYMLWKTKHYSELATGRFFRNCGVQCFKREVLVALNPSGNGPKESDFSSHHKALECFRRSMGLQYEHDERAVKRSVLYQVMLDFVKTAGEFDEHSDKRDNKHKQFLISLTDFERWSSCNGMYLHNLFRYLGAGKVADETRFAYLDLISIMLTNTVEKIRMKSRLDLKKKLRLLDEERKRVQQIQNTLNKFGAAAAIMKIIGGSKVLNMFQESSFKGSNQYFNLIPAALQVGARLMDTGNLEAQNLFMSKFKSFADTHQKPEMDFFFVLGNIIRLCNTTIDREFKVKYCVHGNAVNVLVRAFQLCASLCNGHNADARNFLREQDSSIRSVDIVNDLVIANSSLLEILISHMTYIDCQVFYDKLAPNVWPSMNADKRKFIAWHDTSVKYSDICLLMFAVSVGFEVLKDLSQGPCDKNQQEVMKVARNVPSLLEYIGAMHLKAYSTVTSTMGGERKILWNGGDPYDFYTTYESEMTRIGVFITDRSSDKVIAAKKDWADTKYSLFHPGIISSRSKTSKNILGIDLPVLLAVAKETEICCLRMLLALLEGGDMSRGRKLSGHLNNGILLQNMDNVYKNTFSGGYDDVTLNRSISVLYLTLISTLASLEPDDDSFGMDDLLKSWKEDCEKEGKNVDLLAASVEIVDGDNKIQRAYFPVPDFVNQFWQYPETQKAKKDILETISRASPEEKLADYWKKMDILIRVMRRQERLKNSLTPYLHVFFGGRSNFRIFGEKYNEKSLIQQEKLFLYMTLVINIYIVYLDYANTSYEGYAGESWFNDILNWDNFHYFELSFFSVQFGLACLMCIRSLLNSRAADELKIDSILLLDIFRPLEIFSWIFSSLLGMVYILLESWWRVFVVLLSGAGLYGFFMDIELSFLYSICLLEIVGQISAIEILVEAMRLNVVAIFWTIIIIVIILYIYGVFTYHYLPNQYSFGNYAPLAVNSTTEYAVCNNLIECYRLHLDLGINNPPGWFEWPFIDFGFDDNLSNFFGSILGTAYGISYVVIVNLILQAVISTLIMNTFGAMRDATAALEEDKKTVCFMCSINRDEFETAGINFPDHIKDEHNMWKYLFFKLYLDLKDPLSFSGPEHYAKSQMSEGKQFIKLMPLKHSLSLERRKRTKTGDEAVTLKTLQDTHLMEMTNSSDMDLLLWLLNRKMNFPMKMYTAVALQEMVLSAVVLSLSFARTKTFILYLEAGEYLCPCQQ